ncbi:LpqB family beta-propeller domain-containing protein [Kitasatospora sp. MAA4]|uniref:LpqB family beta-propeller domain-containing protein n=1 Tax=Kitasatospora sp. MAA4 TaxID=3035093 RepID=UPI00247605D5|nr:LpqB family beta-propeller domain-containing protein [Kitasatospora sp. MAA4]
MVTVLLAAGCATMPDTGDPQRVDPVQGVGGDNGVQVRVIPVPPRDGLSPREVVQNFLDASIADERNYTTAMQYLTPDGAKKWKPADGVVVLQNTTPGPPVVESDTAGTEVSIKSSQVGQLDGKHTFTAVPSTPYEAAFTLVNIAKDANGKDSSTKAEWRIDDLPDQLILNQTNFGNTYQQVDRYFYTASDPSATGPQQPVLVPDPIYLRRRIDPASAAANALAEGASDWLAPAVHSAFDGAKIVGPVAGDDPRDPRVQVDGTDISGGKCQLIAAQLYFTLASQGGSGSIDQVTLTGRHGAALCQLTSAQARVSAYAPGALAGGSGGSTPAYFRRPSDGVLMRLSGQDSNTTVPGPFGAAHLPADLAPTAQHLVGEFAVKRDNKVAAVVSQDGKSLFEVGLTDSDKLGQPVVVSGATAPGQGFASPSWDGYGGLWVVDRNPVAPAVLLIRGQTRTVATLDIPADRTVDGIRLSSDGTRAALLLKDGTGAISLWLGLVTHAGSPQAPAVQISTVRQLAPQLSDVVSVSWADTDLLLVLGKEKDSITQLHYVGTDGSQIVETPLQAVDGMTAVAASESRTDPVLADSQDQEHTIYGLSGNAQWQWRSYATNGVLPTYPG